MSKLLLDLCERNGSITDKHKYDAGYAFDGLECAGECNVSYHGDSFNIKGWVDENKIKAKIRQDRFQEKKRKNKDKWSNCENKGDV
jgi:hypothetical protein